MFRDAFSGFRVDTVTAGPMVIVAVYGELDISVQPRVMNEIDRVLQSRPMVLAIDLRGLTFMDSSGIHVLVSASRRAERGGQRFFVIRGTPAVDRLLTACGLDGYFELVASPDQLPDGQILLASGR